jgi:hypothetical protein
MLPIRVPTVKLIIANEGLQQLGRKEMAVHQQVSDGERHRCPDAFPKLLLKRK